MPSRTARLSLAVAASFLLGACGSSASGSDGGFDAGAGEILFPNVPATISATGAEKVAFKLFAKGTQNYECTAQTDGGVEYKFVAPEANLYAGSSENTPDAGRHYAGPTWESANDGSKVVGDGPNAKSVAAPDSGVASIPWLLIPKKSVEGTGEFSTITFVQRISTVGGVLPPAAGCTPGAVAKVAYTATYYLYKAK